MEQEFEGGIGQPPHISDVGQNNNSKCVLNEFCQNKSLSHSLAHLTWYGETNNNSKCVLPLHVYVYVLHVCNTASVYF